MTIHFDCHRSILVNISMMINMVWEKNVKYNAHIYWNVESEMLLCLSFEHSRRERAEQLTTKYGQLYSLTKSIVRVVQTSYFSKLTE